MVTISGWDSDNNRPIVDNPGSATDDIFGIHGAQFIAFTGAAVEIVIFGKAILRVVNSTAGDVVYQDVSPRFANNKAGAEANGIATADLKPVGIVTDAEDKYTGTLHKEVFFTGFVAG